MPNISSVILQNAIALPYKGCVLHYNGGVILPDDLIEFRHTRDWKPRETYYEYSELFELKGNFVLIGPLYPHFGHVMAEMIHRILPNKENFPNTSKYIVISSTIYNKNNISLEKENTERFYLSVLNLFGIKPDDVTVINKPTIIESLAITLQGSDLLGGPKDWYLDLLDNFMVNHFLPKFFNKNRSKNIYVGRSALSTGIIAGESYIENLLAEFGFSTVHPELLSFEEQMEIYASAENIIFAEGSAIHGLELFGRLRFKKIGVITRRDFNTLKYHYDYLYKILNFRSENLFFITSLYLGSAWYKKNSNIQISEHGITLFDLNNLFELFQKFELNVKGKFSIIEFFKTCESDLKKYSSSIQNKTLNYQYYFNLDTLIEIKNQYYNNYRKHLSDIYGVKQLNIDYNIEEIKMNSLIQYPETHSSRRINFFATQFSFERYLEIGVNRGNTFLSVNIKNKVAVDPKFLFEFSNHQSETIEFYQVTSDKFFLNYSKNKIFDIIFIDGLHTFEQTLRDFCNSICHSHNNSIWIIDDTFPLDVYSSLRNPVDAHRFRHVTGDKSDAWHGDVFKLVFAIHDFFPAFSYVTVNTNGNPQTILWRSPRVDFSPAFNNLESISRLTYFDMHKHLDIFNLMTEEEALPFVVKQVLELG